MKDNTYSTNILIAADQYEVEKNYWLTKLSGELIGSFFSYNYKCAVKTGYEGKISTMRFPVDSYTQLKNLSRGSDSRLYMILSSVLIILLHKYSGNEDIIIGAPVLKQLSAGKFMNSMLALRNRVNREMTFKDILLRMSQTFAEAVKNQNYPFDLLLDEINIKGSDHRAGLIFDVVSMLENIHVESFGKKNYNIIFCFAREGDSIAGKVEYNGLIFDRKKIDRIISAYLGILENVLSDINAFVSGIDIIGNEEREKILIDLNGDRAGYPENKTIHQLFEEKVEQSPYRAALVFAGELLTYGELEKKSNQLANYLYMKKNKNPDDLVGIIIEKSFDCIIAILGILKSGGAYVPIPPSQPEERIKNIINDAGIDVVVSQKKFIRLLNRLQWECPSFKTYLCMDSRDIYSEEEVEKSGLMDRKLWEYVGETAADDISGGGWISSYTGLPIAKEEMDEYSENILKKLEHLLHKDTRVLEIGCATGLSMYRIAPRVGFYYGTDLSGIIIEKNKKKIKEEGYRNIHLSCLAAHEIDTLGEGDFNLIIMNSVIQHFHGYHYLRKVIKKAVEKSADNGFIFIGDIMDQDLKQALIRDMVEFKESRKEKNFRTKTDWSTELFTPRAFYDDLVYEIPGISRVEFSNKIRTIENELTKFRFDALLVIDKTGKSNKRTIKKQKYQEDFRVVEVLQTNKLPINVTSQKPAYVIYTSGTTGIPKGVLIEHRNAVSLMVNEKNPFDFNNNDIWTMFHSYSFDFSVWEMYGALLFGGKLVLIPYNVSRDTERFLHILSNESVTVLNQTPSAFYALMNEDLWNSKIKLHLRYIIFGGEALSPAKLERWHQEYPQTILVNMFGITETTVHLTYKQVTERDIEDNISNIGKPIPTMGIYVLSKDFYLMPEGVPGELCAVGEGVGIGYLNDPVLTGEKFAANPFKHNERLYKSGDLVRIIENGELEYLGRIDEQVKIRGYRIELGEIENQLQKYEGVKETIVIARVNEGGERYLCAFVVSDKKLDISDLREFLLNFLPGYMIPSYFIQIKKIPLTANGKTDWKKLPVPEIKAGEKYTAPRDETEEKLAGIWAEVLGENIEHIGIDDNFFELGGHSLRAAVLAAKIHKEFNIKVPLAEIFKNSTIRDIASYISVAEWAKSPGIGHTKSERRIRI